MTIATEITVNQALKYLTTAALRGRPMPAHAAPLAAYFGISPETLQKSIDEARALGIDDGDPGRHLYSYLQAKHSC